MQSPTLCYLSGKTEGGQPLRNLVLPAQLIDRFVALASENTDKGIETCGLLLGTLVSLRAEPMYLSC